MDRLHKFNSKCFLKGIVAAIIFLIITAKVTAQRIPPREIDRPLTGKTDSLRLPGLDSLGQSPVIISSSDNLNIERKDSLIQKMDTFSVRISKDTLDGPVKYYANDSVVVLIKSQKILLYGQTKTEYEDIALTAPKVEIDQVTQILTAVNLKDSIGNIKEEAKFRQGEQGFTSDSIAYNFKSQKGLTKNTITQSGEFFVHGDAAKKVSKSVTYIRGGLFTTCNLDEPHFAFRTSKLKMINEKLAVAGPTHPEFEGVPLPIILPFGFFPLSQGRHSGLLPPQIAQNDQFGFGLEGLGYYKVINNYWDAKVYGNIYSYGGWSVNFNPTYRKRYRYSGSVNFGLQKTKRNFKGDPDYYSNNSYSLLWSHSADMKARPGTTFSANVNASSTTYNRNIPNNPNLNFQNQLGSSITYSKTWIDKPFNLTASANHNQNNQTGIVNVSLPDLGFTMNTIYPFQKKDFSGSRKWYEQLGIGYNGNFRNQVSFYDTAFKFKDILDTIQWGAQHNVPITLSLPPILNGAVVVMPSVSYSQVWIAQKVRRTWNDVTKKVDTSITKGFYIDQQTSFGLSFNTALYGTFNFKKSRVLALRHVFRPTLGASYRPDLSKKHFYDVQVDTSGYKLRFSELQGAIYSGYGEGKNGGLTIQLDNNLEMKWRSKKDTGENAIKKIRLLDGYGLSTSYNFLADSMGLSPIQFYLRTNLFDKLNISAQALMSPYQVDERGKDIGRYAWQGDKFGLGRITSGSISVSGSFQSKPKDEAKDKQRKEQLDQTFNDPVLAGDRQRLLDYMRQNPAEFVDFNTPWQLSISYSLVFSEQFDYETLKFKKRISSSANFNGSFNLAPKWNFSLNGYYDLNTAKLQTFTMAISRDLHCWQMSINVTPVGPYRFFNFTINPKSSLLQDLKVNRTRSFYTP